MRFIVRVLRPIPDNDVALKALWSSFSSIHVSRKDQQISSIVEDLVSRQHLSLSRRGSVIHFQDV
jgi:hypothetical protein